MAYCLYMTSVGSIREAATIWAMLRGNISKWWTIEPKLSQFSPVYRVFLKSDREEKSYESSARVTVEWMRLTAEAPIVRYL